MDIQSILSLFIFVFFLIFATLIGFSFTFITIKFIPDRGFAFSKLLVILLLSYIVWVAGHLDSLFITPIIIAVLIVLSIASCAIYSRHWIEIKTFLADNKQLLIFEELIFITFFITFILIRIGNPDLWHPIMGGEKPMDNAFINSLTRATSLPPYDPWLAGHTINYYYFGQFIVATLAKLLHIQTSILYNIFLAYLFGQSAIAAASIVFSFTKSKLFSVLGGVFLIVSGNLAQIAVIVNSLNLMPPINAWYWTASRVMPNHEINEFPFFAFIYADLHSHLIALPISLLFIYLVIEIIFSMRKKLIKKGIALIILTSFVLGILRITNIWDYPTYLLIGSGSIILTVIFSKYSLKSKLLLSASIPLLILSISHLSVLPFLMHYKTGALGLGLYEGPITTIKDYGIIHGVFLLINIVYLLLLIKPAKIFSLPIFTRLFLYIYLVFLFLLLHSGFYFLISLTVLLLLCALAVITNPKEKYLAPIFLFASAISLTFIPDLIDIKLGLGRMNTVFKFYFQAWVFYALASSIALGYIYQYLKLTRILKHTLSAVFIICITATLTYPLTATPAKIIDRMGNNNTTHTLNGTAFMNNSTYFDRTEINLAHDKQAFNWINNNIHEAPVVIEANTPLYRWGSRVSIYTGLPTVLGWDWHEIAHRQYLPPEYIYTRASDIQSIYENTEFELTKNLLLRYNVSYIYLGQLEKAYYNTQGIEETVTNHPNFFTQVYKNPNVVIYKFTNGKSD